MATIPTSGDTTLDRARSAYAEALAAKQPTPDQIAELRRVRQAQLLDFLNLLGVPSSAKRLMLWDERHHPWAILGATRHAVPVLIARAQRGEIVSAAIRVGSGDTNLLPVGTFLVALGRLLDQYEREPSSVRR